MPKWINLIIIRKNVKQTNKQKTTKKQKNKKQKNKTSTTKTKTTAIFGDESKALWIIYKILQFQHRQMGHIQSLFQPQWLVAHISRPIWLVQSFATSNHTQELLPLHYKTLNMAFGESNHTVIQDYCQFVQMCEQIFFTRSLYKTRIIASPVHTCCSSISDTIWHFTDNKILKIFWWIYLLKAMNHLINLNPFRQILR